MMNIFEKLTELEKEAADFGFKWEITEQIMDQIKSEIKEIEVHFNDGNQDKLQNEIGDLLHAVFSLCVFYQFDPKETLTQSVNKFENRFSTVRRLAMQEGLKDLNGKTFNELMSYWNKAKQLEK